MGANFSFGKNWQIFLGRLTEERIQSATRTLTDFLGIPNFQGKSFLDVGCGSGLFSYIAFLLGAQRIVSFDADSLAVECARTLHQRAGSPAHWEVHEGSVLNQDFLSTLGASTIVYSWGVLHHTGAMWEAIANSAQCVEPGGFYYIAIYNRVDGVFGSKSLWHFKRLYNALPRSGRNVVDSFCALGFVANNLLNWKPPTWHPAIAAHGMEWRTVISDRLGGYPYEYATAGEIVQFVRARFPMFVLTNLKTTNGFGNNWFLFQRAH